MGSKYYILKGMSLSKPQHEEGDQHILNRALIHFLYDESDHMINIYANEIDYTIQLKKCGTRVARVSKGETMSLCRFPLGISFRNR